MPEQPDLDQTAAQRRLLRALAGPRPAPDPPEPDPPDPGSAAGQERPGRSPPRLGTGAAAFDPGRRGVRVLAAVAAVVVLGAAAFAWWSRPQPEPVAPQLAATDPAPGPTVPGTPAELVVAVSGKVRQPGLVRLPPGSRVADAIEAAGGTLPDADLDHLNLARKLTDGELITVGIPAPAGATGPPGTDPGTGAKVNLNTATPAELETLPGIGPALAQRIIGYRTENGAFGSVEELRDVSGIGEVRFAELQDLVTV